MPAAQVAAVAAWNRTETPTAFQSVVERFEAGVARTPDAPALLYEGSAVTYGELNERANQLAHHLLATGGAGSGPAIGLWLARSPEMVVAVWAVLKAGLAYLPVDAECPPGRLVAMLTDAGVRRLLVDASTAEAAATLDCDLIRADDARPGDAANPGVPIHATDLAYLIYTSGSTGTPKGCAIEHHSLANYLHWATAYYWPAPDTGTMALFTPLSFDLTVPSLFCPLLRGRPLVIYPQDLPIDVILRDQLAPGSLVDTIKLTPSHISLLDGAPQPGTPLRLAIVGGEALRPHHVARLTALDPRIRIINEYGPTETTVGCTVKDIVAGEPVTIGRPIANTRIYILDADLHPVAIGVRGEICVGGAGLARGYHGQPALTADRFPADPAVPGARLYRTGDLGRWLPTGELECFGRLDHQVKIRGYRIEPAEVEAALRRCPGIRDAVVLPHEDHDGIASLVAYVISTDAPVSTTIRLALGDTLPAYMVPTAFVRIAEVPLTSNGKLDHARLPQIAMATEARPPYFPPRNHVERRLTRVWEEVLGRTPIGVTEDFFDLGGHSILAVKLMGRVQQEFGRSLPLALLLSHSTIERLGGAIQGGADAQDWRPLVEMRKGHAGPPLFLLPGAGGNVIYFHTLVHNLTTARPVYGLQAVGLDGTAAPLTTVEAIAAVNIEQIRQVWPAGPYYLAGHSFGGQVALEMAQQLRGKGHVVGLLALLDTAAPTFDPVPTGAGWQDAHWLAKIAQEIEEFFGIRLDLTLEDLLPLPVDAQLVRVVERMQHAGAWAPGADPAQLRGYLQVYKANSQAAQVRYDTAARVPVTLFKALAKDPDIDPTPASLVELTKQRDWGWERFASGSVRVFDVPGAHLSMLADPHVKMLARAMDDALSAADAAIGLV